jgi:hypothetical protein
MAWYLIKHKENFTFTFTFAGHFHFVPHICHPFSCYDFYLMSPLQEVFCNIASESCIASLNNLQNKRNGTHGVHNKCRHFPRALSVANFHSEALSIGRLFP